MHLLIDPLLDAAPCGFVSFADDGTILLVNRTLSEMVGFSRAELQGWHLQKLLPPGARIFYNTHVFPILKMHGRADEIYLALQTRDAEQLPVLLNAVRRERDGTFVNDCVFVRMLQRNKFEEQLLEARREAEAASDAKAKFLSMMSHDLRTPLTSVSGHADLLEAGILGPLDDEQKRSVQSIQRASRDVARLLDDILSFAQLESGRVRVNSQPVPVAEALDRAEAVVRLHARQANLTLTADRASTDIHALADRDRLQQILLNLLTNAIKFTPSGGAVTMSAERVGERVRIHVRDTGIGIEPGQLEQVFTAFTQLATRPANEANRGVGLGLAISRDLAAAMNGDLTATSTPGEGSVFTLDLPAA